MDPYNPASDPKNAATQPQMQENQGLATNAANDPHGNAENSHELNPTENAPAESMQVDGASMPNTASQPQYQPNQQMTHSGGPPPPVAMLPPVTPDRPPVPPAYATPPNQAAAHYVPPNLNGHTGMGVPPNAAAAAQAVAAAATASIQSVAAAAVAAGGLASQQGTNGSYYGSGTRDTEPRRGLPRSETWNVFVGNIPGEATEAEIRQFFSSCGEVVSMRLSTSTGKTTHAMQYAFINFLTQEAQAAAVEFHGRVFMGSNLLVNRQRRRGDEARESRRSLFVGNLPHNMSSEGVRQELEPKLGDILQDVRCRTGSGYCFLLFENEQATSNAYDILHGATIQGQTINVEYPRTREEHAAVQAGLDPSEIDRHHRTVYINNLTNDIGETDLRTVYEPYGEITIIKIPRDFNGNVRGYGFVEFRLKKAADVAQGETDGTKIKDIVIKTQISKPKVDKVMNRHPRRYDGRRGRSRERYDMYGRGRHDYGGYGHYDRRDYGHYGGNSYGNYGGHSHSSYDSQYSYGRGAAAVSDGHRDYYGYNRSSYSNAPPPPQSSSSRSYYDQGSSYNAYDPYYDGYRSQAAPTRSSQSYSGYGGSGGGSDWGASGRSSGTSGHDDQMHSSSDSRYGSSSGSSYPYQSHQSSNYPSYDSSYSSYGSNAPPSTSTSGAPASSSYGYGKAPSDRNWSNAGNAPYRPY